MKRFGAFALAVVALWALAVPADAQTGAGSLRGYIKDEQGGALPGVTVDGDARRT